MIVYVCEEYDQLVWQGGTIDFVPPVGTVVCVDSVFWQVSSVTYYPENNTVVVSVVEESLGLEKKPNASSRQTTNGGAILDIGNRQNRLEKKARRVFAEVANLKKQTSTKSRENNGPR